MSGPKFSILICSLVDRAPLLGRLQERLQPQLGPSVEVLTCVDDRQRSIGDKRNELLGRARGEYVAFIDDDDLVPEHYVRSVLGAVSTDPDCVGLRGEISVNGLDPRVFIHSLRYQSWFEQGGVYYRNPNHLNPVRRELALRVGFPSQNMGEDHDYSKRLLPLLRTEVFVDPILYFYLVRKEISTSHSSGKGTPRLG